jgi:hypothetical protein
MIHPYLSLLSNEWPINVSPHIQEISLCKSLLAGQQQSMVTGECHWKMGKPIWKVVCCYSIKSKDGDVA